MRETPCKERQMQGTSQPEDRIAGPLCLQWALPNEAKQGINIARADRGGWSGRCGAPQAFSPAPFEPGARYGSRAAPQASARRSRLHAALAGLVLGSRTAWMPVAA